MDRRFERSAFFIGIKCRVMHQDAMNFSIQRHNKVCMEWCKLTGTVPFKEKSPLVGLPSRLFLEKKR